MCYKLKFVKVDKYGGLHRYIKIKYENILCTYVIYIFHIFYLKIDMFIKLGLTNWFINTRPVLMRVDLFYYKKRKT